MRSPTSTVQSSAEVSGFARIEADFKSVSPSMSNQAHILRSSRYCSSIAYLLPRLEIATEIENRGGGGRGGRGGESDFSCPEREAG